LQNLQKIPSGSSFRIIRGFDPPPPDAASDAVVLVQIFEGRQTEPIFNFSLRGKHRFPYLQDHGPRAGDLRCVELSFFDFVCQLD
jgi:hypothetical protein